MSQAPHRNPEKSNIESNLNAAFRIWTCFSYQIHGARCLFVCLFHMFVFVLGKTPWIWIFLDNIPTEISTSKKKPFQTKNFWRFVASNLPQNLARMQAMAISGQSSVLLRPHFVSGNTINHLSWWRHVETYEVVLEMPHNLQGCVPMYHYIKVTFKTRWCMSFCIAVFWAPSLCLGAAMSTGDWTWALFWWWFQIDIRSFLFSNQTFLDGLVPRVRFSPFCSIKYFFHTNFLIYLCWLVTSHTFL